MKGFDPKFADLPDYILKITKEILGGPRPPHARPLLRARHRHALPLGHRPRQRGVIDGTLATLAEMPDRQLLGEDVIWSGDEDAGFLSSHRLVTSGTHTGHGLFGPPTGRSFTIRVIADCAAKDDVIYDEWLIRDYSGIAKQLGFDTVEFTRDEIAREGGPGQGAAPVHPGRRRPGPYTSRGNDNEWGQRLADILTRIMDKDLTVIRAEYDRAVRTEHPGAVGGWSWDFAETRVDAAALVLPLGDFAVHHVIGRADPGQPHRAAVRWSLDGKHDGFGAFGAPTGAHVHVMGITHAEFGPWGLRREFTLFDEISIWKQILLHTGAAT